MPAFTDPYGVSQQTVADMIAASSVFVQPGTMTIDSLHVSYPPAAPVRGKYGRVNNYGGTIDKVMRCDFDSLSTLYFWGPAGAPQSFQTMDVSSADIVVNPLVNGDIINLTGAVGVGVTRTVTLTTTRGRPGDVKTLKNNLTTLVGNLNFIGAGLGAGIASLLGVTASFGCQWSGTQLEWTRLT